MKKLILFVILLPLVAMGAPACQGSATDSGTIAFSAWTAPGFTCQQQDKIYSSFSFTGTLPNDTTLRLLVQSLDDLAFDTVMFSGNFLNPFAIAYTIEVDAATSSNHIVGVSGDLVNPASVGNPTLLATVSSPTNVPLGTVTSALASPGAPLAIDQTVVDITVAYTANGGGATGIANSFLQSGSTPPTAVTPEPATMVLVGAGFIALGFSRRRRT